jgi:DNA processing protein
MAMSDDELLAWLRLTQAPGVGDESARRLLAAFGSPQAVLEAGPRCWQDVVGPNAAAGLARPTDDADRLHVRTVRWLAEDRRRRQVLSWGDADYPAALLNTASPPPLLYAQGRVALLSAPSLAMVGSRHATPQGRDNARAFAAALSQEGLTIVSGLALGIDGAAHEGALEGAGSTVAVIGTGPEQVYPSRHQSLARRIAEDGLILSEFPVGTPPLPPNFPKRNRLIAGLSLGTLVVEAAMQSGSLITARLALDDNRDVFAIPGSIHSPQSRGCHHLIKQGAKLVETAEDILQELRWRPTPLATEAPNPLEAEDGPAAALMRALGHDPVTLDALVARSGWPAAELNVMLLTLELEGQVTRLPGGLFQRHRAA